MAWLAVATGLAIGLSLAAPPGPVNALIAREASRNGLLAGIRAGIAAPILDSLFLVLVLAGANLLPVERFTPGLAALGAGLMAYLAVTTARARPAATALASPLAVVAVTVTNPFQYAWWVAWGTTQAPQLGAAGVAGFLVAIFGWVIAFSALVRAGALRWDWFEPLVGILSADVLLFFALHLAVQAGL